MTNSTFHQAAKLGAVSLCALFLFSCRSRQTLVQTQLSETNATQLLTKLHENQFPFEWLGGKAASKVVLGEKTNNFKTTFVIRRDSAIWARLSIANIEGARVLITTDSVKFLNRQNKTFFSGDFQLINERLNANLTFEMLQNLLVGNQVVDFAADEKIEASIDSAFYTISNVNARKLRNGEESDKALERIAKKESTFTQYWLDSATYKIVRFSSQDFKENLGVEASYSNFEPLEEQVFPRKATLNLHNEKTSTAVELKITKLKLNIPQKIPFKIPDSYDQIY